MQLQATIIKIYIYIYFVSSRSSSTCLQISNSNNSNYATGLQGEAVVSVDTCLHTKTRHPTNQTNKTSEATRVTQ